MVAHKKMSNEQLASIELGVRQGLNRAQQAHGVGSVALLPVTSSHGNKPRQKQSHSRLLRDDTQGIQAKDSKEVYTLPTRDLESQRDVNLKLLTNQAIIQRLPDKGERIRQRIAVIQKELQFREAAMQVEDRLALLNLKGSPSKRPIETNRTPLEIRPTSLIPVPKPPPPGEKQVEFVSMQDSVIAERDQRQKRQEALLDLDKERETRLATYAEFGNVHRRHNSSEDEEDIQDDDASSLNDQNDHSEDDGSQDDNS